VEPWITAELRPLYAPTCNLLLYLGTPESKAQLPTFDPDFREPSMEDVLFCLEARWRRECDFAVHQARSFHNSSWLLR
jgi:hypothetical protein